MSDQLPGMAPSMVAVELSFETMPDWLRVATVHRFRGPRDVRQLSWHIYARAAIEHSGLPGIPRAVLRLVVDWHSNGATAVEPRIAEIVYRVGFEDRSVRYALEDLDTWGWLATTARPGRPSILTVLCPVEEPPVRCGKSRLPRHVVPDPPRHVVPGVRHVVPDTLARGAGHRSQEQRSNKKEPRALQRATRPETRVGEPVHSWLALADGTLIPHPDEQQ